MDRSAKIKLISVTHTQDALKVWTDTPKEREVFCEVSSVSQSEWFEGGRTGLNPALRFRMFAPDYQGEKTLKYNGTEYTIYRTYVDRNETIDLYTEQRKG